jgi:hypothetical protein
MGRRRTGVNKVREIIRYGCTTELSEQQIARALEISRTAGQDAAGLPVFVNVVVASTLP